MAATTATTLASIKLPERAVALRSVFLKSLRDHRVGILGWGLGLGLLMFVGTSAFPTTAAGRLTLKALAIGFTWYAEPVAVDTLGGFLTWDIVPVIGILLSVWALLAASRTLRGEEESGTLDLLLALPSSRSRTVVAKLGAIAVCLVSTGLVIGLVTGASALRAPSAAYGWAEALLLCLNVALLAFFFAALTLFLGQFTRTRGAAAGLSGGLLGLSFLLDGIGRVVGSETLRRSSPFYYFGLSKPLVPSYGANPGAMIVVLIGALVLAAAAIGLFVRRDLGAPALHFTVLHLIFGRRQRSTSAPNRSVQNAHSVQRALPVGDWTLRSVYTRSLRALTVMTFWVAVVVVAYGALATSVTRQEEQVIADFYQGTPFAALLATSGANADTRFLATIFSFLVVAPAIYAFLLVSRWASAEEQGRLELLLATPRSRTRVLLAHFAALTTGVVVVAAAFGASVGALVATQGLTVDGVTLVEAVGGMVPVALVVGAVGYLLAGWLRAGPLVGVLSLLFVASFFVPLLGSGLKLPDWAQQLSIFQQYGNPLVDGLHWANMLALLGVAAVALLLATWRFARKDIGR
jgi:ABC-2 type transport system permease protein